MDKNIYKENHMAMPIENHITASLANIEQVKNVSRVPIPTEHEVTNAKDYVEKNQK